MAIRAKLEAAFRDQMHFISGKFENRRKLSYVSAKFSFGALVEEVLAEVCKAVKQTHGVTIRNVSVRTNDKAETFSLSLVILDET